MAKSNTVALKGHSPIIYEERLVSDIRTIIDRGRYKAYASVGNITIQTFWNIGKRIVEEEQQGNERALYGSQLIKKLSESLVSLYGSCYNKRNLDYYRKFYLLFPDEEIVNTRVHNLTFCCKVYDLYAFRRRTSIRNRTPKEFLFGTFSLSQKDNDKLA